ncbi:YVTN repeat-like/Quino protein amine dehydrogenase [Ramicandelaber brevisporus]|nr:YVTN repeat-like/Quino protein amine dehydrogenase [Ramicandelaber brevisporus]
MRVEIAQFFRQTGNNACSFSSDGRLIATATQHRLIVRNADSLQVVQVFQTNATPSNISEIQWCPTCPHLVFVIRERSNLVEVFDVRNPDWGACIDESLMGLVSARWVPLPFSTAKEACIMTLCSFSMRLTVWSLRNGDAWFIPMPKSGLPMGNIVAFSPDGRHAAVAVRKDKETRDYISVLTTDDWTEQRCFAVDTLDLRSLHWSPDGRFITVVDSIIDYKVHVYTPLGVHKGSYSASDGMGIRVLKWSPTSHFIAVGGYDQRIRLLNHYTWKPFAVLNHAINSPGGQQVNVTPCTVHSEQSVTSDHILPDVNKPEPRLGIGLMEFSSDGAYLMSRNDNMPNTIWIWDTNTFRLACVIHTLHPVKMVKWSPVAPDELAFITGSHTAAGPSSPYLYLWTPSTGCTATNVALEAGSSSELGVGSIAWNSLGHSLSVTTKDLFSVAFPVGL